jgi:hypothetical protein
MLQIPVRDRRQTVESTTIYFTTIYNYTINLYITQLCSLNFYVKIQGLGMCMNRKYRRRGRSDRKTRKKRRKLLDELKERRGYCHLKEAALDSTMWRAGFGRGFGPVVRQTDN